MATYIKMNKVFINGSTDTYFNEFTHIILNKNANISIYESSIYIFDCNGEIDYTTIVINDNDKKLIFDCVSYTITHKNYE